MNTHYGSGKAGCDTLQKSIERKTMRKLTMEISLADNLNKCHQQDQSPLYSKIPKEIRDLIFEFATEQWEDLDNPYKKTAFYYRPGYRGPHKTSTSLLRTCRRIWLETNTLPMRQSKRTFWAQTDRGPRNQVNSDPSRNWNTWTTLNLKNFETLHIFAQKHMADNMFKPNDGMLRNMRDLQPKVLRVTMRHTDWNRWEDPLPLEFDDAWVRRVINNPALGFLQRFEVEFETIKKNKDQLQAIVDRVSKLEGSARPSNSASASAPATRLKCTEKPQVSLWIGPPNINDHVDDAHQGMDQLDYHVVLLTWKAVSATSSEAIGTEEGIANRARLANRAALQAFRFGGMSSHTLRRRLQQDGWERMQFPFANYTLLYADCGNAESMEKQRREQFQISFADIEARKLREEWKAKDSLLKFEE